MRLRFVISGFFLSCILAFIVSYFFVDTLDVYEWDPAVQEYVYRNDSVHRHRSEGEGNSKIGKHGIIGISDVTELQGPKILIWGDSYVEAWQVEDHQKMSQVVTLLFHLNGFDDHTAVSIGHSGNDIADYYYKLPKYEKIFASVIGHYIIITCKDDISPDGKGKRYMFKSSPTYHFVDTKQKPRMQQLVKKLAAFELHFIGQLLRSVHFDNSFRFKLGPIEHTQAKVEPQSVNPDPSVWNFLLEKMKEQTNPTTTLIVFIC